MAWQGWEGRSHLQQVAREHLAVQRLHAVRLLEQQLLRPRYLLPPLGSPEVCLLLVGLRAVAAVVRLRQAWRAGRPEQTVLVRERALVPGHAAC
jgi:hypothetical protein